MTEINLDRIIEQLKGQELPDCPASVEANVLRRIRLTKKDERAGALSFFWDLLSRPGFAVFIFTSGILLSSLISVEIVQARVNSEKHKQLSAASLDFQTFDLENTLFNRPSQE